jgi:hypothetical protein
MRQSQRGWSILLQTVPGASRSFCRISHLHGGTPVVQDSRDGYPPKKIQIPENNPCNGKKNAFRQKCMLGFSTPFHSSPAPLASITN